MSTESLLRILTSIVLLSTTTVKAQPNWPAIKANATFIVPDTNYLAPHIQSINVPGWEDGLYMTRDGKHLFSTYLPLDAFSWITDLQANPICFDFDPYYRPPLLGIDTISNPWGCPNFMNSDIITTERSDPALNFNDWHPSNLRTSMYFEGGVCGVLKNPDTFDVFVYTKDLGAPLNMELKLMCNVPSNPSYNTEVNILSSPAQEDNPHIERLNDSTLLLLFDRSRYIYYSLSYDNGVHWQTATQITNVLNDQAPYDVQPHLWNDGMDWWVYFCANNADNKRCIYKSKQQIPNDWNSWGAKELVIEPSVITDGSGLIFGVGEPSLTTNGDLSFVVVYGNNTTADTTDVYDCDPWILPRKPSPLAVDNIQLPSSLKVYPNPASDYLFISSSRLLKGEVQIFNTMGKVVKEASIASTNSINIQDLPNGLYFIRLKNSQEVALRFIKSGL